MHKARPIMSSKEVIPHQDNVDLIRLNGKEIYLVGTAHVSKKSADLAESVIREIQPDTVAVELCQPRYLSLKDPERWKNTNVVEVIRQGRSSLLLVQLILSSFQRRVGKQLGVKPGEEMMRAVEVAEDIGAETVMADREVKITLSRTWSSMGFFSMLKVMGTLIGSLFTEEAVDEDEIERLKSSDVLAETLKDFSKALPEVRTSLIDERDQYLAAKIAAAPGDKVVAVVGAGHVPGILQYIGDAIDVERLETIPPPKKFGKILAWLIPLIILAIFIYGFIHGGAQTSLDMFRDWFLINGVAGALGSALAFAHPLTILAAFVASPFTSLNPTIAGGWVAGLTEAWLRKPRVSDFESLADEVNSLKGFWTNRVTRILLVVILTNLLGTIGTFVGGYFVSTHI